MDLEVANFQTNPGTLGPLGAEPEVVGRGINLPSNVPRPWSGGGGRYLQKGTSQGGLWNREKPGSPCSFFRAKSCKMGAPLEASWILNFVRTWGKQINHGFAMWGSTTSKCFINHRTSGATRFGAKASSLQECRFLRWWFQSFSTSFWNFSKLFHPNIQVTAFLAAEPLTSDVELGPAGAGTRFTPRFKSSQGVQGALGGSVMSPKIQLFFLPSWGLYLERSAEQISDTIFLGIFGFAKKPTWPWRCWIRQVWNSHSGLLDVHPDVSLLGVLQGATRGCRWLEDVGRLGLEDWDNDQELGVRPSPSDASILVMRYCSASVQEQCLYKKLAGWFPKSSW